MQHARPNRLRRAVAFAALAALLGAVSLTLSQCTMVGDNLTGVDLQRAGPTSCTKQCNDTYAGLYKMEQKRHLAAIEVCQSLAQPAKGECLVAEDALAAANRDALGAGKIACQNDCHRQGAGSAG